VRDHLLCVPNARGAIVETFEEREVLAPRQLCNDPLHDLLVRPGHGERAHVLQVSRRETIHVGKRLAQIEREPIDHLGAPPFFALAREDDLADVPVEMHHRRVRCENGGNARLGDSVLDLA